VALSSVHMASRVASWMGLAWLWISTRSSLRARSGRRLTLVAKRAPRSVRFYTLKHSAGRLEITRDENKMKNALAQCGDHVLKTDKSLGATQL